MSSDLLIGAVITLPIGMAFGTFITTHAERTWRRQEENTRRLISAWRGINMKTYKVEVKAHFDDDGKQKLMEEACKDAARNLLATAVLLSAPRSTPDAMVQTEDWIQGVTVHDLQEVPPEVTNG